MRLKRDGVDRHHWLRTIDPFDCISHRSMVPTSVLPNGSTAYWQASAA